MEMYQFLVLVGMIAGGFAWMLTWLHSIYHRLNDMETRLTVVENISLQLALRIGYEMGAPIKTVREKK